MASKPNYLLCFLGQLAFFGAINLWLFSIFNMASKPVMIGFAMIMTTNQALSHARLQRSRWKDRSKTHSTPQKNKSNWLFYLVLGLVLLIASEAWLYFLPTNTPKLVWLGMTLFPLGAFLDSYLNELGIERPLRNWHKQSENASPQISTVPTTTAVQPTVQRVGRP